MKRLILLLFFTLFLPFSLQATEPVIHAVIAADGRAGLGANLFADRRNMERLFRENVPNNRLNLVLMDLDAITPDTILQTISRLELTENDTLVFYYSGRAAHNRDSNADSGAGVGGHYFQLRDEQGGLVRLYRRTLLAALKEKNARLTVLLTDCCNVADEAIDVATKASSVRRINSPRL